jgi:predicted NUDIX family NTP pyrophosphohydrolase
LSADAARGGTLARVTTSAGLILFRERDGALEVLLGHMGGPFWARKDVGAWSIPKGELDAGEEPRAGALREFAEELGHAPPDGPLIELGEIRQKGGKRVVAFALEGDFDPAGLRPGTFELEWPPRSGRRQAFPELDRVAWLALSEALEKVVRGQVGLLERLAELRSAG